jgi:hypothetical protein
MNPCLKYTGLIVIVLGATVSSGDAEARGYRCWTRSYGFGVKYAYSNQMMAHGAVNAQAIGNAQSSPTNMPDPAPIDPLPDAAVADDVATSNTSKLSPAPAAAR